MRLSLVILPLVGLILLTLEVHDSDALYPYAIKGFVKDVKHKPHLFIGAWALKKFIKLKIIKWKFHVAKKLIIKKKIKAALILSLLKKIKKKVHRHFYHRKKRQVQDYVPWAPADYDVKEDEEFEYYDKEELPGREPSEEEIMAYLSMASDLDRQGCLPKGVCEVVAKGNGTHLNHFENMVYDTFGDGQRPKSNRDSPSYMYEYAAFIGKTSGDVRTCEQLFKSCQEPPQALNTFMDSTFTSETCEFPDDQMSRKNSAYASPDDDVVQPQYSHIHPQSYHSQHSQPHPSLRVPVVSSNINNNNDNARRHNTDNSNRSRPPGLIKFSNE